jgi:hypothetical protein
VADPQGRLHAPCRPVAEGCPALGAIVQYATECRFHEELHRLRRSRIAGCPPTPRISGAITGVKCTFA